MTRPALILALSTVAGLAATAAWADEPVVTARPQPVATAAQASATTAAVPAAAPSVAAQIDSWIKQAPPVDLDDQAPDGVVTSEGPRKVHGEVGVSVGSGGYRSAYVVSVMPIGQTGTLALAVSETKGGRHGGYGYGGYGYGGPGFGGPFGYGFGGTQSALGVSLALGQPDETRCRQYPGGPVAFEDHAGPDLYRAECRARGRMNGQPD